MKRYESGCVECGLPCMGKACRHYEVVIYECDRCGDEVNKLYKVDGEELCNNCVLDSFEVVE